MLTPNQENLGKHLGFITWESDEVLAKRALNRLLKIDRETAEALKISKKVFRKYIESIERAGLIGSQLSQELAYRDRIQEILEVISNNQELLDEAASVCFALDPVKQKMEEKAKEEYQKKLSEHIAQLDVDLTAKKQEVKDAETELDKKKSQIASLQAQIANAEQQLTEQVDHFDTELTERLREVAKKPERLFAEMAFIGAISSSVRPTISMSSREALCTKNIVAPEAPAIREPSALVGALSQRLLSNGVSPQIGQVLHCALLSGTVPIVIGPDALDVVRSYADCVSGGVFHWIPVGGALFEATDLLGRIDPSSRSFVPHPGGLLELLLDDSDTVHLVVLDGFNRAASDGYLLPIVQLLRDTAEGHCRLTIPLVPPGIARDGDPYGAAHQVAWSRNVLLVLRPTMGTSMLPVPRELWEHCVMIDTDSAAVVVDSTPKQATRVPKTDWNMWFDRAFSLSTPIEKLSEHPNAHAPLPRCIRRKIERIYGAGVALGLNSDRATDQALKVGLVPYLVTCDEPLDEWLKVLGLELNEQDKRAENIVRRLGG